MSKTEVHPPTRVAAVSQAYMPLAREVGKRLGLAVLDAPLGASDSGAPGLIVRCGDTLALQLGGPRAPGPVAVDFGAATMRHRRQSGHNELLGKAVGVGKKTPLRVVDATAGLGRDSFVLADLGCEVLLCERNPLVYLLLEDGLRRAGAGDAWLCQVAARMQLWRGDSVAALAQAEPSWDVIYLDPMFPPRDKRAAVKKEMALFHTLLEGDAQDQEELLAWALAQSVARVVVKRPPRSAHLGQLAPSHSIKGKAVRYDVHVLRALA